ncbi:MAG TPA: hypothetical protein VHQ90_03125 [Thermoanaerobaculia bacterium]|nr:hypothetical protein [Thermoanaerobaculia bacterium]
MVRLGSRRIVVALVLTALLLPAASLNAAGWQGRERGESTFSLSAAIEQGAGALWRLLGQMFAKSAPQIDLNGIK